ncbi:MAG: AAA family ATPase [Saprospiraceae bacterium]|nr:AAA family ATPase [Saprospiraceae bacterium]
MNQEIIDILELAIINPKVEAKVIFELISAIPSMNARTISQLAITMADFDSNINPNVYGQLISKKLEDMRSSNLKVSTEGLIRIINKYPFFETGLEKTIQSPSLLLHRLGKSIRGQEEVLSALSNHFYQWQLFWDRAKTGFTMKPSSIPLLIGNTGTGKTFTVQKMANILGAGFITIDASRLVTEGYVGSNISTELISQYQICLMIKRPDYCFFG